MPNKDESPVVKLIVSFLITDVPQMATSLAHDTNATDPANDLFARKES